MSLSFSVVTPSYNQGAFIERTIKSVLAQDDVAFDYMVCDGGSTDQTTSILAAYGDRLRWISEADGGQAAAVNKGIAATRGDIIAWINSDDTYLPGAFRKVQTVFEEHPEVNVVYGKAFHIDCEDRTIESYPTEAWDYNRLKEFCFLCQPAVFFRRSMVAAFGPLNAELQYCMDYELWLRYGRHSLFHYLEEPLAHSRFYVENKTLGQRLAVHHEINEMMKSTFGIVPEKWVLTYAHVTQDEDEKLAVNAFPAGIAQCRRIRGFVAEAFKGAWRWRNGRISPGAIWMMLRWLYLAHSRQLVARLRGRGRMGA